MQSAVRGLKAERVRENDVQRLGCVCVHIQFPHLFARTFGIVKDAADKTT
jgi:hypothetical protein